MLAYARHAKSGYKSRAATRSNIATPLPMAPPADFYISCKLHSETYLEASRIEPICTIFSQLMSLPTAESISPADSLPVVKSHLYFLKKNPLHLTEKPYAFRFRLEDESIPQTNMEMERKGPIVISDIRGSEESFSLESNGFTVLKLKSELLPEDFYNSEKVPIYLRELESLLKGHFKCSHVEIFRYGVSFFLRISIVSP